GPPHDGTRILLLEPGRTRQTMLFSCLSVELRLNLTKWSSLAGKSDALPPAAESLEEVGRGGEAVGLRLHETVLVCEHGALRIKRREEIGGAGAVAQLRQAERLARLVGRRLQRAHLGGARFHGRQRVLHLLEGGEHGLPVGGDELLLARLAELELALELSAF